MLTIALIMIFYTLGPGEITTNLDKDGDFSLTEDPEFCTPRKSRGFEKYKSPKKRLKNNGMKNLKLQLLISVLLLQIYFEKVQ